MPKVYTVPVSNKFSAFACNSDSEDVILDAQAASATVAAQQKSNTNKDEAVPNKPKNTDQEYTDVAEEEVEPRGINKGRRLGQRKEKNPVHDRQSRTGRGREIRKGGAGGHSWGTSNPTRREVDDILETLDEHVGAIPEGAEPAVECNVKSYLAKQDEEAALGLKSPAKKSEAANANVQYRQLDLVSSKSATSTENRNKVILETSAEVSFNFSRPRFNKERSGRGPTRPRRGGFQSSNRNGEKRESSTENTRREPSSTPAGQSEENPRPRRNFGGPRDRTVRSRSGNGPRNSAPKYNLDSSKDFPSL